jgi:hypothetical protein
MLTPQEAVYALPAIPEAIRDAFADWQESATAGVPAGEVCDWIDSQVGGEPIGLTPDTDEYSAWWGDFWQLFESWLESGDTEEVCDECRANGPNRTCACGSAGGDR